MQTKTKAVERFACDWYAYSISLRPDSNERLYFLNASHINPCCSFSSRRLAHSLMLVSMNLHWSGLRSKVGWFVRARLGRGINDWLQVWLLYSRQHHVHLTVSDFPYRNLLSCYKSAMVYCHCCKSRRWQVEPLMALFLWSTGDVLFSMFGSLA